MIYLAISHLMEMSVSLQNPHTISATLVLISLSAQVHISVKENLRSGITGLLDC